MSHLYGLSAVWCRRTCLFTSDADLKCLSQSDFVHLKGLSPVWINLCRAMVDADTIFPQYGQGCRNISFKCLRLWCFIRAPFSLKDFPHSVQECFFSSRDSPWMKFKCRNMLDLWAKLLPHSAHRNGFSFVWTLSWDIRSPSVLNFKPHWAHWYGRRPVCFHSCTIKMRSLEKTFGQWLHVNGLFILWMFSQWLRKGLKRVKVSSQRLHWNSVCEALCLAKVSALRNTFLHTSQ